MKKFCFFAILLLLFSATSFAQEDEDPTETGDEETVIEDAFVESADDADLLIEEEKIIISSPDVVPTSIFPRHGDTRLPIGKPIELLIGFRNTGQKTFNVTSIHGSFRYPGDLSIFIQNFTSWRGGAVVRPNQHVTFQYFFFPDELLEPKEYLFVATAFYSDEDNINYTTTFFNGTIYMVEDTTPLDLITFFTYFLVLGVLGLVGYVLYTTVGSGKKGGFRITSGSSNPVETGTVSSGTNEWAESATLSSWKKQKEADKKGNKKAKK